MHLYHPPWQPKLVVPSTELELGSTARLKQIHSQWCYTSFPSRMVYWLGAGTLSSNHTTPSLNSISSRLPGNVAQSLVSGITGVSLDPSKVHLNLGSKLAIPDQPSLSQNEPPSSRVRYVFSSATKWEGLLQSSCTISQFNSCLNYNVSFRKSSKLHLNT